MATILGLLLVVTVIANYLATTLPAQMSVNDLNHEIAVENQLGHFQAVLNGLARGGAAGAPSVQAITLGSEGAPPFAAPDGATVSSIPFEQPANVSFGVVSTRYGPPTGWIAGTGTPAGCSGTYPNFSCTGGATVTYNFTNQGGVISFHLSGKDGADLTLNYSANNSLIIVDVTGNGGKGFENIQIVGNNNTAWINAAGGATQNLTVIGNYNDVNLNATSGSTVTVRMVGDHDTVTLSTTNGFSNNVYVSGWGSNDTFNPGTGGAYSVWWTGFNAENPNEPFCPYGNLSSTDSVGPLTRSHESGTVSYNNTVYNNTATQGGWNVIYNTPTPYACIYFAQYPGGGASVYAASLLVRMANTYAPAADVAFDQGAVIYAQPGGYPIMIDPPAISYAYGTATVVIPAFLNLVGSESGIGMAAVSLHLVAASRYSFPGFGWVLDPHHHPLVMKFQTPYAYAWLHYFKGVPSIAPYVSCAPLTSAACVGPFEPNGPLGTVTFRLPATSLSLVLAVYSVSLH